MGKGEGDESGMGFGPNSLEQEFSAVCPLQSTRFFVVSHSHSGDLSRLKAIKVRGHERLWSGTGTVNVTNKKLMGQPVLFPWSCQAAHT